MSVVTAHMVYFCAFARSEIFQENARKSGVGRRQFDAGVNGLIRISVKVMEDRLCIEHSVLIIQMVFPSADRLTLTYVFWTV